MSGHSGIDRPPRIEVVAFRRQQFDEPMDHISVRAERKRRTYTVGTRRIATNIGGVEFPSFTPVEWLVGLCVALAVIYGFDVRPPLGLVIPVCIAFLGGAQWLLNRDLVLLRSSDAVDDVMQAAHRLEYDRRAAHDWGTEFADALAGHDREHLLTVAQHVLTDTRHEPPVDPQSPVATETVDPIANRLRAAAQMLAARGRPGDAEAADAVADGLEDLPAVVDQEDTRHAAVAICDAYAAGDRLGTTAGQDVDAVIDAATGLLRRTHNYLLDQDRDNLRALRLYSRQWAESELAIDR